VETPEQVEALNSQAVVSLDDRYNPGTSKKKMILAPLQEVKRFHLVNILASAPFFLALSPRGVTMPLF
jgi:hypothetical protein